MTNELNVILRDVMLKIHKLAGQRRDTLCDYTAALVSSCIASAVATAVYDTRITQQEISDRMLIDVVDRVNLALEGDIPGTEVINMHPVSKTKH